MSTNRGFDSSFSERAFEWLTQRLDHQDQILSDILKQARLTNGTLLEHEKRIAVLERADAEEEREQEQEVRRSAVHRARVAAFVGWGATLLAGGLGWLLAHIFG